MDYLALSVVMLIFLIGFLGTFLPILPGTVIAFAGVFIHRLWMGDASVSWNFVLFSFVLAILSQVLDYVMTVWGAKRFGASWKGALGALLGGIAGMIFAGFIGMIIGPILGAVLFELLDNRTFPQAARAGYGTFIGGILALAGKIALTMAIIVGFFVALP